MFALMLLILPESVLSAVSTVYVPELLGIKLVCTIPTIRYACRIVGICDIEH